MDRNWCFAALKGREKLSLSARRAWIEIPGRSGPRRGRDWSLSARRAWIEIEVENGFAGVLLSLSARRAWIEMIFPLSPLN